MRVTSRCSQTNKGSFTPRGRFSKADGWRTLPVREFENSRTENWRIGGSSRYVDQDLETGGLRRQFECPGRGCQREKIFAPRSAVVSVRSSDASVHEDV